MPMQCCKEFWDKIPDDEPVFILAGRDLTSSERIQDWINEAEFLGVNPDKIERAKNHLKWVKEFQQNNSERCKIPD